MQKIKVCHLTTAHEPFDERIFHKECKSLFSAGYDVTLIAPYDKNDVVDGIRIVALGVAKNRFHRFVIMNFLLLYKSILQKADIYHFHDPELLIAGVLIKILTFKKVIYDAHEDYEKQLLSKGWIRPALRKPLAYVIRSIEKISCKIYDFIITAGLHTKIKFPDEKSTVIANYPPVEFIPEIKVKRNSVMKLIYAGGISKDRGILIMLEVMQLLRDKNIELHLLGDIQDTYLITSFETMGNVKYHGCLPWNDVNRYLADADMGLILFQPSPAYYDMSGDNVIKLFEYMLAELCVLISDFPKLSKLISDLGCGLSVDPTDPIQIANKIEYLYNNAELRKQMGIIGRKAVLDKYNWDNESKKLLAVYKTLH